MKRPGQYLAHPLDWSFVWFTVMLITQWLHHLETANCEDKAIKKRNG